MKKLITALFDFEDQVINATAAIQQLTENGDIIIDELYIVSKNEQGKIIIKDAKNKEITYLGGDAFAGSIIGMLKGSLTALTGLTTGALHKKNIEDLRQYHKTSKMLRKTFKTIPAGKIAIIAHVEEYWEIPLNMTLDPFDVDIKRVNLNE